MRKDLPPPLVPPPGQGEGQKYWSLAMDNGRRGSSRSTAPFLGRSFNLDAARGLACSLRAAAARSRRWTRGGAEKLDESWVESLAIFEVSQGPAISLF